VLLQIPRVGALQFRLLAVFLYVQYIANEAGGWFLFDLVRVRYISLGVKDANPDRNKQKDAGNSAEGCFFESISLINSLFQRADKIPGFSFDEHRFSP